MIYLLLAIASSALVSITMRMSEKHVKNQMGMFMANYAICSLLSYLLMDQATRLTLFSMSSFTFWMGVISGFLYLAGFVFLKMNMKHNGIVMSSTFMKLGVIIPTVMAVIVFHEFPKWSQVVGIILSLLAIIMINFEKNTDQKSNKKSWLMVLLLISGITDSMANIFDKMGNSSQKDAYLLMTFLFACLLTVIIASLEKNKLSIKDFVYGLIIGIPNYFSARFLLLALGSIDAVLVYPMYSVATIITISLFGVFFFKEKLSLQKQYALGIILLAICLMNI